MKIFDCFTFNDENLILELRLNELKKFVDYFVIIEFGENHQGKKKGKKIDKKILKRFNNKIRYFYIEKFPKNLNSWDRENFQRNTILKGLKDASKDDIIIISDLDEIPNLNKLNLRDINDTIYAFRQINTMYKFNLIRDSDWLGSKLCKFKKLKSPQWLRSLKVRKKYNLLRLDKLFSNNYVHNSKIIENGGWHFGWIREISQIIQKLESFAHTEFNNDKFKNFDFIEECIKKKVNFLDTNEKLEKIELNQLPKYLIKNKNKFKHFL